MKDAAYYIKTGIFMILLAVESFALSKTLLEYVRSEDYFSPPIKTLGIIVGLLLLLIHTYSLTIGAWKKWEQYVVVPLPVSLGIFFALFFLNPTYAMLVSAIAYILLSYDMFVTTRIKDSMIKFNPVLVLKFSIRGFLFIFALLSAVLVFLHSADKNNQFDLSEKIADLAQQQVNKILKPQLDEAKIPPYLLDELEGKGLPPNPEDLSMLSGLQGDTNSLIEGLPTFNLDLKETVKKEVELIIRPYQQFIPPLIALVVFALIRFLGTIAHLLFSITSPLLFRLAKSLGLLHTEYIPVEKEELSFAAVGGGN